MLFRSGPPPAAGVPCCKEALYHILADETVNTFLPWVPLKSLNGGEHVYNGYWNQYSIHFMEAGVGSPWEGADLQALWRRDT